MRIYAFHAMTTEEGQKEVLASGYPLKKIQGTKFTELHANAKGDKNAYQKILQKMDHLFVPVQPERCVDFLLHYLFSLICFSVFVEN